MVLASGYCLLQVVTEWYLQPVEQVISTNVGWTEHERVATLRELGFVSRLSPGNVRIYEYRVLLRDERLLFGKSDESRGYTALLAQRPTWIPLWINALNQFASRGEFNQQFNRALLYALDLTKNNHQYASRLVELSLRHWTHLDWHTRDELANKLSEYNLTPLLLKLAKEKAMLNFVCATVGQTDVMSLCEP